MATNNLNSSLNLVDLDFASLKSSLTNYLRSQSQFADYDFDGASINVLLELLALNTNKIAFLQNMTNAEGHLDSAQLRNSILSKAKELNYTPRSTRSAKAKIRVSFDATGESQPYIIEKGSQISTFIKGQSFVFSIPETITVASGNNSFTFDSEIYEGVYNKDGYIFQAGVENQRFKITNKNVDTSSITVVVYEDGDQVGQVYTNAVSMLGLTEFSKVFFLQTNQTGHYEIFFGDNIIGRQPKTNSTIIIDYRISNGPLGNGARQFSVDFDPTGYSQLTSTPEVVVLETASNGAEMETDESIKYYAPRHYQVQERAVVDTDYQILLKRQFPELNAVAVYGGETVDPPLFGKVIIAVDIANVDGLPDSKKNEYTAFISKRMVGPIRPIFKSAEFTYFVVYGNIRYNLNITAASINRINTLVSDTITSYNQKYLDDFNSTLRLSSLTSLIDQSDPSIISNQLVVDIYKKINPTLNVDQQILIDFGTELDSNDRHQYSNYSTIYSTVFTYKGQLVTLVDDQEGNVYINDSVRNKNITKIGTVNYTTGSITLSKFNIDDYQGSAIKLFAVPKDKDISSTMNNILTIEADQIHLTIEPLRI